MKCIRNIALFLLLNMPVLAFAGILDVTPEDKSMQYLGQIFGSMGSLPLSAGTNSLIPSLYYLFNEIVFALGLVIIIVTTVIGTINTAQEGEALGKKMSSIWVPARAGFGIFLLLPSVGNYNWIQLTVMWLIVQGVGAANALWRQTLDSLASEGSVVADTRKEDTTNMMPALRALFQSTVCMQVINNLVVSKTDAAASMKNQFVEIKPLADGTGIQFSRGGAPDTEKPMCGSVSIPSVITNPLTGSQSANDPVVQERRQMYIDALMLAQQSMEPSAAEAIANSDSSTWQYANLWTAAARALRSAKENVEKAANAQTIVTGAGGSYSQNYEKAKLDGWIHAGNYYSQMVNTGNYKPITLTIVPQPPNTDAITQNIPSAYANDAILTIQGTNKYTGQKTITDAYSDYVGTISTITPAAAMSGSLAPIPITTPSGPGQSAQITGILLGGSFFQDAAAGLGRTITTGCLSNSSDPNSQLGDPIECMATYGATLANAAEMTFWIAMGLILLIWLPVSIMKVCQPIGFTFDQLLAIILPIAVIILLLIWGAGLTLAIYVPLIPLLVFTFASITWVLLVIEAMLGAPLIALTLIVPSEDEIGKAGHAIVILLGLFLRPALMILGFIFAQKLLMVAIGILNFGFQGAMKMSIVGGVGPFGFCAILLMYVGIAVALVHESFSLIYVLPDKVLRWMGVAGEGSDAGQLAKEMEGYHEKGAAIGQSAMKGGLKAGQDMVSG